MEFKDLGKTGEKIPAIGWGTWKYGADPKEEVSALKLGFERGFRFVDTAEMYNSETIVGEAIKDAEDIFVATKVSPSHFDYDGVMNACDGSLKRLGIRQIDLYQLHWPNKSIPISETMRAMEKLVDDGKIRYIGVSNFSEGEIEEAQGVLKHNEIVSDQVEYSVLVRQIENGLMDYCRKNRISIIAYSPLGQGKLYSKKYSRLYELLEGIGRSHGKSATQVALNWVVSKENVVAIPKAGSAKHVLEDCESAGWKLDKEEMEKINSFLA